MRERLFEAGWEVALAERIGAEGVVSLGTKERAALLKSDVSTEIDVIRQDDCVAVVGTIDPLIGLLAAAFETPVVMAEDLL